MESSEAKDIFVFNKYHWVLEWPKLWIISLGVILIILDLIILGMEIGHTVMNVHRSTAFGGILLFLPFLVYAICVLITAFQPRLALLRATMILSIVAIIFSILLIDYDIFVLIDPSRCFFLDCNAAQVVVNETYYVTGWPLSVTWPSAFQTSMTGKRILQSIQLTAAALFILCAVCYLLTFFLYRNLDMYSPSALNIERDEFDLSSRVSSERKNIQEVVIYRARPASELNYEKVCTRCLREPRMRLSTERNIFSHLCRKCHQEWLEQRPRPVIIERRDHRWYDDYH